ncbi:MAG TPA: SDR family NAD(P)-dependent oxidoreductase, partial [Rubrobacter sp.]|nr:SDR family NAD(P)-dependent oxidoreductase [Rubrobacter sp.]
MGVLEDFNLDGKVALVTGAARGLGQGIAVGLAEAGADVAALDIDLVDETGDLVRNEGGRFYAMNVDLLESDAKLAAEVVAECVSELGRLDILVNNAGIIRRAPALEFGEEDWEAVIKINLSAAFYLSQAAARHFIAEDKGGKIV